MIKHSSKEGAIQALNRLGGENFYDDDLRIVFRYIQATEDISPVKEWLNKIEQINDISFLGLLMMIVSEFPFQFKGLKDKILPLVNIVDDDGAYYITNFIITIEVDPKYTEEQIKRLKSFDNEMLDGNLAILAKVNWPSHWQCS